MDVIRLRAPRWIAAGLGALLLAASVRLAPAAAATSSFDVGDQAVINVFTRGAGNDVAIRSWDRPIVQIESDESPTIDRRSVAFGGPGGQPLEQPVGPANFRQPDGSRIVVPPENFPLSGMRPGTHDVVSISTGPRAHLVVTVPASVGLVRAIVGAGTTDVESYRGANLFLLQGGGRARIAKSTTTAFVQLGGGIFEAVDDTFDRLRARANGASLLFEGCRSKQIETSTVRGNIVYDAGTFDPGLARFESQSGVVALGVAGAAQVTGRSDDGHVYASFQAAGTPVAQQGPNAVTATIAGGGALVNVLSTHGDVYIYDGSLRNRRMVSPEFRRLQQAFTRRVLAPPPARGAPSAPSSPGARVDSKARTSAASRRRA